MNKYIVQRGHQLYIKFAVGFFVYTSKYEGFFY